MIPAGGLSADAVVEARRQTSRTYALSGNRVTGTVDGLEAVRQAVGKLLQTDRFAYFIYSGNYGHECTLALGRDASLAEPEVGRLIREALLQDDRVIAVEQLSVQSEGDRLVASFTVVSSFGRFTAQQEVG
ncbi:DUF2634 domain-containing protein [Paenibacillus hodogayensis]|uniref:DUF2634 domain-containing protein n=1 Tax=Paenibacillus hodogayensis TaxID=279208 RepID=A0ABV5W1J0_9BACL